MAARPSDEAAGTNTATSAAPLKPGATGWTADHDAGYQLGLQHGAAQNGPGGLDAIGANAIAASKTPVSTTTTATGPAATVSPSITGHVGDTIKDPITPQGQAFAAKVAGQQRSVYPQIPGTPSAASVLTTNQAQLDAPLVSEQLRKSQHINAEDWNQRPGGSQNPFTNGFFKRPGAQLATLPRPITPPPPTPEVGGTTAVVPAPVPPGGARVGQNGATISGTNASGQNQNMLTSPFGGGVTTFDPTPGTRKPFIGGANGENVAGDYVAGGQFSSAKAGSDPTLDQNYVAGLPRRNNTRAVTQQPAGIFKRRS